MIGMEIEDKIILRIVVLMLVLRLVILTFDIFYSPDASASQCGESQTTCECKCECK